MKKQQSRMFFLTLKKKKQEPVWYKLKNGAQRMQRNPKMFLRKDNLRIRRMEQAKNVAQGLMHS
jgi:hypothetical protein